MKVAVAAVSHLFLLLLLLIAIPLGFQTETSLRPRTYQPTDCCFTHLTRAIPRERISSYYETSSQCPKPGIIFITIIGRFVCANPRDDWVQDYIKELKEI
uniref:C-C motif chemokine n=2 Tax=Sus scrofa TaxID=9823 RepID=A0A8D1BJ89_PIG